MKNIFFILSVVFVSNVYGQLLGDLAKGQQPAQQSTQVQAQTKLGKASKGTSYKHISKEISQEEFDDLFLKASKGDDNAQLALGVLYARGVKPVSVNAEFAIEWLTKSANKGNLAAMTYLGVIYSEGKLVKKDINKAIYWRELAAEKGSAADKYALANAFIYGYTLPADKQKAFYWLTKAAETGDIRAIDQLISIYSSNGDKENVSRWKTEKSYAKIKLAQAGDVSAMFEAYRMYISGKGGVYKSIPKALYWLIRASDNGHIQAMETLASMYIRGKFVEKDFNKAISLLEKLAKTDVVYAIKISAVYGEVGDNQNLQKAEMWLDKAGENFSKLNNINKLYVVWKFWAGNGVVKNIPKASKYCNAMIAEAKGDTQKAFLSQIKKDIDNNKPAPESFSDLCK